MISSDWLEILRCSECGSPYDFAGETLVCRRCDARFPVVDGIPVLITETTRGTQLEDIDYDAVHRISEQTVRTTGAQWKKIIERMGLEPDHALEIGAGTGVLTLGLLEEKAVRRLTAVDVSHKFLRLLAPRVAADPTPVSMVACDANEPHFRREAFDLALGRSILHHLIDYDVTLRQCHATLKPGGAAVFFEPVLEGKTVLSLLMALVLRGDAMTKEPRLTFQEQERISRLIDNQMKSKWYPQDRESLSLLEDKYIFEIDQLKAAGREAGFTDVEFLNNGDVKPNYWPHLVRIFGRCGIRREGFQPYEWVAEEFARTWGIMYADKLVSPMGYFVFRK